MKYLVTGAAGFIGASLVRRLISDGNICTTIDNLSTGKKANVPNGCRLIVGDVSDPEIINGLDNEYYDAIIHIAGQSSGEVSFENPLYDLHTNVQSTLLLLEYAKRTGCKKFIYASSMSVYGENGIECCCENDETSPKSFYAVGKLASENYMRIYSQYGIECIALRFFNVYGIGQNLDNLKQGMASIYLAMAINDKEINVKGSKDRFRDFVYIDDVVEAVVLSLDYHCDFDVFNICTGKKTHVYEVIESIKDGLNYPIEVNYLLGTPGDQFGIYGNNSKAKANLKWKNTIDFKSGMNKMIDWAKNGKL